MRSPFTSSLTAKPDQLLHSFDHSSTSATFAAQLLQRSVHVPKTLHLPCSSAFPPIKFRPVRARLTPFKTSRHLVLSARFRYPFRTRFITALSHRTSPFISTKSIGERGGSGCKIAPHQYSTILQLPVRRPLFSRSLSFTPNPPDYRVLFPQVPASSWTRWATKFQVHSFAQHAQVVCHADHSEVQVFLFPLEFKPVAMTFVSLHELRFEGGC